MSITPSMWHGRDFQSLSWRGQVLWCYLLTTRVEVPGLLCSNVHTLAGMLRTENNHWPVVEVAQALDEHRRRAWIEIDPDYDMIRIPAGPKYRPPGNPNVLKGWFRRWKELPPSPLKFAHIEQLFDALPKNQSTPKFFEVWRTTFATIKPFERLSTPGKAFDQGELFETTKKSENFVKPSPSAFESTRSGSVSGTGSGTEGAMLSKAFPDATRKICEEVWALQEDLRAKIPGLRGRAAVDDDLRQISAILEAGHSRADCEHVLRVYAAQAAADPKSARYFNGTTNWRPEVFRRALGMPIVSATARPASSERDLDEWAANLGK